MNLVWHIARKDIRRMAWPVAAWLVFTAATTAWFSTTKPGSSGELVSGTDAWLTLLRIWTNLIMVVQWVIAGVLCAAIVLEDPVVGASSWWRTRPIANGRNFAGKLVAVFVLLVAAPGVVLSIVWFANGFTVGDVLRQMPALAIGQLGAVLLPLMVASLVGGLAPFLFATVAVLGAYVLVDIVAQMSLPRPLPAAAILQAREFLVRSGAFAGAVVVLTHQFLSGRTARSWSLIGAGLIGIAALRLLWPWTEPRGWPGARAPRPLPPEMARGVEVAPTLMTFNRSPKEVPWLRVTAPWSKSEFLVPEEGRYESGENLLKGSPGQFDLAARRVLGFDPDERPLRWQLFQMGPRRLSIDPSFSANPSAKISGELIFALMKPRIVGEVPLETGRELVAGSSRTTILGFARTGEQLDAIFLTDRDPAGSWNLITAQPRHGDASEYDAYVLILRSDGVVQALSSTNDTAIVEFNGVRVGARRLPVYGNRSWAGASLAKVRFIRELRYSYPFSVEGVAPEGGRR